MKNDKKTLLIAVARNEDCYLHEWIFHHIYMGFDKIVIGINRTDDNSIQILNLIKLKYPQVEYEILDWMDCAGADVSKGIQRLSYSYLTNKYFSHGITDVMYLDIDEFWFSKDFGEGINTFLSKAPEYDVLSFSWLMQQGDDNAFTAPFTNKACNPAEMVKSVVSSRVISRINDYYAHNPRITGDYVHLDGKFKKYIYHEKTDQMSGFKVDDSHPAYVLHRVIRSEEEYISLLLRGRPSGGRIKSNRFGFKINSSGRFDLNTITIPNSYYVKLENFATHCEITKLLVENRNNRLSTIKNILNVGISTLISEFDILIQVLNGTALFDELVLKINNECVDANVLRDCAIKLEKYKIEYSLLLMSKALEIRPHGPLIRSKIKEYESNGA